MISYLLEYDVIFLILSYHIEIQHITQGVFYVLSWLDFLLVSIAEFTCFHELKAICQVFQI